jgi:hypothetical protein
MKTASLLSRENVLTSHDLTLKTGNIMAKCPKCKKEVGPTKTWKMVGKKDKSGKRTELTIGLHKCCGKTFRSVINKRKI